MHFKQIGILIGGGGLIVLFAAMQEPEIQSAHDDGESVVAATQQAPVPSSFKAGEVPQFAVATPVGFTAKNDGNGVLFVQDGDIRTPLTVRIDLKSEAVMKSPAEERQSTAGLARYQVEELEGGSAGPLWRLNATRDTPKGILTMEANLQSELGPPDFRKAWEIFESVVVSH